VSANILAVDFHVILYPVFLGVELLVLPLISLKAFETARLMGRRNVDFDEKEAAILEHVFAESKNGEKNSSV
jgi:hypothetical protein